MKVKMPKMDGLLPGCAPLINKVATSPPRHVARSYNRSRCCPTSIRPRELVLSTSTPSVAPSLPPQPEFHFHKLAMSSACSHGAAIIATGQLCDGVGRILSFPPIQDDWLPRMNASKDLFLIRLEDFRPEPNWAVGPREASHGELTSRENAVKTNCVYTQGRMRAMRSWPSYDGAGMAGSGRLKHGPFSPSLPFAMEQWPNPTYRDWREHIA
ncbi:unnamed protein product [Fusarium graminearum]|nr:unnamed protein product [Fusarium graminearum]